MGACFSAGGFVTDPHGAARERYNRELEETSSTLTHLGCSKRTAQRCMDMYKRADRDKDGEVNVLEFARTVDVETSNPFLPRLVSLFDVSGDGVLSPFEFIVCLSQFRNRGRKDEHVYFAWRLFDTDGDGSMSKDDFREALGATYFRGDGDVTEVEVKFPKEHGRRGNKHGNGSGPKASQKHAKGGKPRRIIGDGGMRKGRGLANFGGTGGMAKGLDQIIKDVDADGDGRVTVNEFRKLVRNYQHVVAPAFDLWTKLAEVSAPAVKLRSEVTKKGNLSRLIALAMKSSDERRALVKAPVVGTSSSLKPKREGLFARLGSRNGSDADNGMAVFKASDPGVAQPGKKTQAKIEKSLSYDENKELGDAEADADDEEKRLNDLIEAYDMHHGGSDLYDNPEVKQKRKKSQRRENGGGGDKYAPSGETRKKNLPGGGVEKKRSWRVPSFGSQKLLQPPPMTKDEIEMERACASTDDEQF